MQPLDTLWPIVSGALVARDAVDLAGRNTWGPRARRAGFAPRRRPNPRVNNAGARSFLRRAKIPTRPLGLAGHISAPPDHL